MDVLEVKAWLSGGRPESEIARLESSVDRLRGYLDIARSMGVNACGASVERYAALVSDYVSELEANAADVRRVISQVPNETQRRVLECRYVHGLTIEQTADAVSYCAKSVNRYHAAALESVKAILERRGEWTKTVL